MNKIPIGIKSCERNSERRIACRNTWIDFLDKDKYLPLFLIGRKNQPSEIVGDILYLDCEDHYQGLSGKVKAYYKWALDNTEVSHFWICDDDSYINHNNFNTFEEYKNYDYIGSFIYGIDKTNNSGGFASGCGMCVSRKAAELCSIHLLYIAPDDVCIGDVLNEHMPHIKKFDPHTIHPWSYCTYHSTLLIGHYIHKGEGSLSTFTESMNKMHSLYTTNNFQNTIIKNYIQIGSNVGNDLFQHMISQSTEKLNVILIEPNVDLLSDLSKNYNQLKEIHDINILAYGISLTDEKIFNMYIYPESGHASLIHRRTHPLKPITTKKIITTTFNSLCEQLSITNIELLFIDAEGFDYEILNSIDLSKIDINNIIFEYWPHENDDLNSQYRTGDQFLWDVVVPKYKNYLLDTTTEKYKFTKIIPEK